MVINKTAFEAADAMQYIDETELLYTGAPAPVYMD